jgi:hypothetical protein
MPVYQILTSAVSHDLLDGEVIAIHFVTGTYYSLREAAAKIWEKLLEPTSAARMGTHFAGATDAEIAQIQSFLEELANEGLLIRSEGTDSGASGSGEWGPFSHPVFEKYSDMQELLLADPIHDVQEQAGWPYLKPDNAP